MDVHGIATSRQARTAPRWLQKLGAIYPFHALRPSNNPCNRTTERVGICLPRAEDTIDTARSPGNLAIAEAPISEPETYAPMLTGLSAMGFVVRRRKTG